MKTKNQKRSCKITGSSKIAAVKYVVECAMGYAMKGACHPDSWDAIEQETRDMIAELYYLFSGRWMSQKRLLRFMKELEG